jgi:hydrogenase-4 component B
VKAFGVIFLGEPRRLIRYTQVRSSLTGPVLALGGLALLLGVFPGPVLAVFQQISPIRASGAFNHLTAPAHTSLTAALLLGLVALFVALTRPWAIRTVPRWSSGRVPDASMQWTAASFTKAIRTTFAFIYRPHRELTPVGPHAPEFPDGWLYEGGTKPVWERYLYRPLYRWTWYASQLSTRLQAGPVRLYLAYLLGTVGIMLLLLH